MKLKVHPAYEQASGNRSTRVSNERALTGVDGWRVSVHLGKDVFQCFHPPCGAAGNVLDLWCAIHHLTPYEGARHLAKTFDLELTRYTEKQEPVTEHVTLLS